MISCYLCTLTEFFEIQKRVPISSDYLLFKYHTLCMEKFILCAACSLIFLRDKFDPFAWC